MIQSISIFISISLLSFIIYVMYKQRLRKEYSLLWLFLCTSILIFSIWREGLEKLAAWCGVYYAPALLFMLAFLIIILILIHLSVVVSSLKDQLKILSQKIALLEAEARKG